MEKICKKHGLTAFSSSNKSRCKKCAVIAVTKRRQKVKQLAIDYKGGKCINCGYNKCAAALQFHHKDPAIKSFDISVAGFTRSWQKIKEELDKCDVLCANCHAEEHWL